MSENGSTPTFDFSGVSREWSQQFFKLAQIATRAQITLQRPLRPDATPEQIEAFYDKQDKALDIIGELSDQQLALIAQVLKEVPEDWLISGAPGGLDWSDKASYQWIQDDHYAEILQMVQSGEARKKAKN